MRMALRSRYGFVSLALVLALAASGVDAQSTTEPEGTFAGPRARNVEPLPAPTTGGQIFSLGTFVSSCAEEFELVLSVTPSGAQQIELLDASGEPVRVAVDDAGAAVLLTTTAGTTTVRGYSPPSGSAPVWRDTHGRRPTIKQTTTCPKPNPQHTRRKSRRSAH